MNSRRKLLEVLRIPSNQTCADCSIPLTTDVHCAVPLGIFICSECGKAHISLSNQEKEKRKEEVKITDNVTSNITDSKKSSLKSSNSVLYTNLENDSFGSGFEPYSVKSVRLDKWNSYEVSQVESKGNSAVNGVYEKYLPLHWTKPDKDVSDLLRYRYIEAKYYRKLFILPDYVGELACIQNPDDPSSMSLLMRTITSRSKSAQSDSDDVHDNADEKKRRKSSKSQKDEISQNLTKEVKVEESVSNNQNISENETTLRSEHDENDGEVNNDEGEEDMPTDEEFEPPVDRFMDHFMVVGLPWEEQFKLNQDPKERSGESEATIIQAMVDGNTEINNRLNIEIIDETDSDDYDDEDVILENEDCLKSRNDRQNMNAKVYHKEDLLDLIDEIQSIKFVPKVLDAYPDAPKKKKKKSKNKKNSTETSQVSKNEKDQNDIHYTGDNVSKIDRANNIAKSLSVETSTTRNKPHPNTTSKVAPLRKDYLSPPPSHVAMFAYPEHYGLCFKVIKKGNQGEDEEDEEEEPTESEVLLRTHLEKLKSSSLSVTLERSSSEFERGSSPSKLSSNSTSLDVDTAVEKGKFQFEEGDEVLPTLSDVIPEKRNQQVAVTPFYNEADKSSLETKEDVIKKGGFKSKSEKLEKMRKNSKLQDAIHYNFVLTDEKGTRLFASALRIYEEVDPLSMATILENSISDSLKQKLLQKETLLNPTVINTVSVESSVDVDLNDGISRAFDTNKSGNGNGNNENQSKKTGDGAVVDHLPLSYEEKYAKQIEDSFLVQAELKQKLASKLRKLHELTLKRRPDGSYCSSHTLLVSKCLIVDSRYMFFDTCKLFLSQLYRLSLHESPISLEAFISHFVSEIPLPPFGQMKVKCNLLDKFHLVNRSPVNALPALDFSIRPLLSLLSVENILAVVECLLVEAKVCLVSHHLSLLAPTASAFLALLFPFSWQGAYIPVMPANMLDILDAPVPFFVGVYYQSLANAFGDDYDVDKTTVEDNMAYLGVARPREVVYVDLDNNCVDLGVDEATGYMRKVYHNEQQGFSVRGDGYIRAFDKLRGAINKAVESTNKVNSVGDASLSSSSSMRGGGSKSTMRGSSISQSMSFSRSASPPRVSLSLHRSSNSYTSSFGDRASSVSDRNSTSLSTPRGNSGGINSNSTPALSLFPINGKNESLKESFMSVSEHELVAKSDMAFPNDEHLVEFKTFRCEDSPRLTDGSPYKPFRISEDYYNTAKKSPKSQKAASSSLPVYATPSIHDSFDGTMEVREAFMRLLVFLFQGYEKHVSVDEVTGEPELDRDAYLKEADHFKGLTSSSVQVMQQVMSSQMFQRFLQECLAKPTRPEVLFFSEKIIEKQNRGTLKKTVPTPFLDDQSDDIRQTFSTLPSFMSNQTLANRQDDPALLDEEKEKEQRDVLYFPSKLDRSYFCDYRPPSPLGHPSRLDVNVKPQKHVSEEFFASMRNRLSGSNRKSFSSQSGKLNQSMGEDGFNAAGNGSNLNQRRKSLDASSLVRNSSLAHDHNSSEGLSVGDEEENEAGNVRMMRKASRRGSDLRHSGMAAGVSTAAIVSMNRISETPPRSLSPKQRNEEYQVARLSEKKLYALPDGQRRFMKTVLGLDKIRAVYHGYKLRQRLRDEKYAYEGIVLQKVARKFLALIKYRRDTKAMRFVQRKVHIWLLRRWIKKCRLAIIKIQSMFRQHRCKHCCFGVRCAVVYIQCIWRGTRQRRLFSEQQKHRFHSVRNHLVLLWSLASTSLIHRSSVWMLYCEPTLLNIASLEYEARCLWKKLKLKVPLQEEERFQHGLLNVAAPPTLSFSFSNMSSTIGWSKPFQLQLPLMLTAIEEYQTSFMNRNQLLRRNKSKRNSFSFGNSGGGGGGGDGGQEGSEKHSETSSNVFLVAEERKALYLRLRDSQKHHNTSGGGAHKRRDSYSSSNSMGSGRSGGAGDMLTEELFSKFQLSDKKKRKQTLSEVVWSDDADPDASAEVVMGSLHQEHGSIALLFQYWISSQHHRPKSVGSIHNEIAAVSPKMTNEISASAQGQVLTPTVTSRILSMDSLPIPTSPKNPKDEKAWKTAQFSIHKKLADELKCNQLNHVCRESFYLVAACSMTCLQRQIYPELDSKKQKSETTGSGSKLSRPIDIRQYLLTGSRQHSTTSSSGHRNALDKPFSFKSSSYIKDIVLKNPKRLRMFYRSFGSSTGRCLL